MRILHLPTHVGNQPWGVSLAERSLGHESRVLVYRKLNPSYGADFDLHFERRPWIGRSAMAFRYFLRSLATFDIFHFYFATSFFPNFLDLSVLRALGKKLFFTFQGCDIRAARACPPALLDPIKHSHAPEDIQQRRLRTILRYAEKTYVLNPDLLDFSPTSQFVPYGSVDFRNWEVTYRPYRPGEEVVIFHAPSDRLVKGTDHLEAAISKLQRSGYKIRLDLAHGIPNDEVKRRLRNAHLAVDQLIIGYYGAAAVEMMAQGKPTVCFLRDEWMQRDPLLRNVPLVNATTKTILPVLKDLLDHPNHWADISARSRRYVETVHDPVRIAQRLIEDYRLALDGGEKIQS